MAPAANLTAPTRPSSRWLVAISVCAVAVGCGQGFNSAACEAAAEDQVYAEQRWGELLEQHTAAHESGATHNQLAQLIAGARLEVILAEAETRRTCR